VNNFCFPAASLIDGPERCDKKEGDSKGKNSFFPVFLTKQFRFSIIRSCQLTEKASSFFL